MRISNNTSSLRPGRVLLLAGMLLLGCIQAHSQITIGGDIYGGGREGAVGTAKAQDPTASKNAVQLTTGAADPGITTEIKINSGTVRTVFGGGENGRTFGNTKITIQQANNTTTQIGSTDWDGSIYGGVFGAGDGESAFVFGHSSVHIKGGTVYQNVYGGGNRADLMGSTTVRLSGGNIKKSVFGGARVANIYGFSFVNLDGANAANNLEISAVYGGNDIAGDINSSNLWDWTQSPTIPDVLGLANTQINTFKNYNAFVYSSAEANNKHIFVGQLYGGGNGDYTYTENAEDNTKMDMNALWKTRTKNQDNSYSYTYQTFTVSKTPEVERVYLELKGGTYGYVYGGGNKANVTENVDICLNNQTELADIYNIELTTLEAMGLNYDLDDTGEHGAYTIANGKLKSKYQFDRVFGGNNKVPMDLQPAWHMTKATINNLYSGGNAGDMTHNKGLLLTLTSSDLEVNNVYGGCRRANVIPDLPANQVVGEMSGSAGGYTYKFPEGHSARIFISAGKINNVYGGNDISGKVIGGNAIDIRSSIKGDVYGGGNGSYAYTDNADLRTHQKYGDFYYTIPQGKTSAQALNDFRPNAEQAWIHVQGASENNPTVIGGSLYLGGNSATLDIDENDQAAGDKNATLKIGSYVIAKNVFLGSNGANMVDADMLAMYHNGTVTVGGQAKPFSTITMNNANFAEYIKGVSIGIKPQVLFDDDYEFNSTKIGSFFFGGNLGSVTASGTFNVTFTKPVVIFEKLVAGCNNANFTYNNGLTGTQLINIDYDQGGVTTAPESGQPKINMTLDGITLMPGYIAYDNNNKPYVAWNTTGTGDAKRLIGGNIFGGCYTSGKINGSVVINLTSAAYDDETLYQESGVARDKQLNDVFSTALSIFGGGYGPGASIEGSTTINISNTGRILKVFGGGLQGPVNGSTAINLTGGKVGKIYGGGFEGRINGHTTVNLDGGTVYSAFGGACNANIRDYAQVFVGKKLSGITTVENNVYGGNDFGGRIEGTGNFSGEGYVTTAESGMAHSQAVLTSSTYVEYVQGNITNNIFGGSCGAYDYTTSPYSGHIITDAYNPNSPLPYLVSSFVHFKGNSNSQNAVQRVFGAGEGAEGKSSADNVQDKMQQRSYVMLNSTAENTFKTTDVFGGGAFSGLGMDIAQSNRTLSDLENHSAIVDLMGGWINNAYGASYNEGVTRRTIVNVPENSTAKMANLFGGGYGSKLTSPCDAYESHVNWNSGDASCGYIYGGNNNMRRVLYTFVNINAEAWSNKSSDYLTTVYGAGCGSNTWAEYTSVNLNEGALVYEVYGGGYGGKVLNLESVNAWADQTRADNVGNTDTNHDDLYTVIGEGYTDYGLAADQPSNEPLVGVNGLGKRTNTNVYINKGAIVGLRSDRRDQNIYPVVIYGGYGYGGGYGDKAQYDATDGASFDISMGSVSGTTYIGLHGGIAWKDIYAGGTLGGVYDLFKTKSFTAESNAYVEGGAVRNVYGAGWKGRVGYTELPVTVDLDNTDVDEKLSHDIPGASYVEIGIKPEYEAHIEELAENHESEHWGFYKGLPTVERNAYSSGEDGGCVIGTANLTVYGGYVGYRYQAIDSRSNFTGHMFTPANDNGKGNYVEKTYDETWTYDSQHPNSDDGTDRLLDAGNVFGGGYTDNATADNTVVTVWGGHIRNSVYGGGEVAAIGRGEALQTQGSAIRRLKGIYVSGSTQVNIYSGNIDRNVFGGGKGYNNNGTKGALLTDGYVFGTTEVNIYGGEIGTDITVLEGDGNVFGGGNIGYVFNSKNSKKFDGDGYYYKIDANKDFITQGTEKLLSEDCKVVVTPYSRVLSDAGLTLTAADGERKTFAQYDFVPTKFLDVIPKNDARWYNENTKKGDLDITGVIIHNAIFAGGNVSSGNELYANTKTVFGNATATINDLYYCDLITVGTEHIGGLYGDGNLTRVDGYRELNITNYGTDYYGMNTDRVTLDDYEKMNDRERAYFQLKYVSKVAFTYNNTPYPVGTILTQDEIKEEFDPGTTAGDLLIINANGTPNDAVWDKYGFVSIYAGRLINTIQRADFCGVFGSRMVMQGARDRVPETVDFTDYTINRVGEVSLNRMKDPNDATKHNGNYFGIYNIVNHLAALTSDIDLTETRVTAKSTDDPHYHPSAANNGSDVSYIGWKEANKLNRRRNDGEADNKVALASGVYLEITTEESTQDDKKWGLITGVLELNLINVMPGLGGGYVYAKNEHGVRTETGLQHITLSPYNKNAVSNKKFTYSTNLTVNDDFQTSGNLVSDKTIIDDCYPISDSYYGDNHAEGHYWYIKGEIYLYDIYLSAYTGAADAYSKTVSIPLTITAGSHGVIQLQDVKPNKFLYYGSDNATRLGLEDNIKINNITYALNDTISYWDWLQLSELDQAKFVDKTYVTVADCKVGNTTYPKGYVLNETDYQSFYNLLTDKTVHHVAKNKDVPVTDVFRPSNDMSHDKGYALTLDMNNPDAWNVYYTSPTGLTKTTSDTHPANYLKAPTYKVNKSGIYGQREYGKGDIITKSVYDVYQDLVTNHSGLLPETGNAVFKPAYVMKEDWSVEIDGTIRYFNKGLVMSAEDAAIVGSKAGPALYCIDTWKLSYPGLVDDYVFYGTSMTQGEIEAIAEVYHITGQDLTNAINAHFAPAYICTTAGKYGGDYYALGNNYVAKEAWSAMNPEDRENFDFNYDAFDVLIDPNFSGRPMLYDGENLEQTGTYSGPQHIDYTAKCIVNSVSYINAQGVTVNDIIKNDILDRETYESLPNEQYHYSPFKASGTTAYIVKSPFTVGNKSYSVGNSISAETWGGLSGDNKQKIDVLTGLTDDVKYYYCRDPYTIGANGTEAGKSGAVTSIFELDEEEHPIVISSGTVHAGVVITESNYDLLPNVQKYFSIHGKTPVGVSTLYVSGQSNILDLSKGRIYTVTYTYDYEESDDEGNNINQVNEKHIVNIHVNFEGGTPTISPISAPPTILPGSTIGITQPRVTPGAYEVIGGGWELFTSQLDAQNHENGAEFENGNTVLYWYNNDYYLAYYAKTYLGKTYSNAVPIKVGNYHDLSRVMADKAHHMYVDHPNVKRNSKIYISGDKYDTPKAADATENELDMLKEFYELSLYNLTYDQTTNDPIAIASGDYQGHVPLNKHVKGGQNLDFILKTDVAPMKYTNWTSIGDDTQCFRGTLHGDGHTISGLNNSLFGHLCGKVYNLGVTGTFTSPGIADIGGAQGEAHVGHAGHVENVWINTTGTFTENVKPVMGGTTGTVVNAYYPEEITGYTAREGVTARPMSAFHNGEVTYDLNGFYLAKRYAIENDPNDNKYFYTITDDALNELSQLPTDYVAPSASDYVANRYADGDFIYASGRIPDQTSERMFFKEATTGDPDPKNQKYFPIYPDDYIFFGQMLTYGYSDVRGEQYQEYPSSINRADRNASEGHGHATQWIVREEANSSSSVKSNRVYRVPAYFGNSTMNVAHFNANAFLPAKTNDGLTNVYPGMTALDLTGYGDDTWNNGWTQDGKFFMTKVLDYNSLTGFRSDGQTRNLLVYSNFGATASNSILTTYMEDQSKPAWTNANYKNIAILQPELESRVKGHLVVKVGNSYQAYDDQFLVDAQDFNAPIEYSFLEEDYMWYQRNPARFVNSMNSGWDVISLPFTAEIVTTQQKGEITHFYTDNNIGHEYWLREFDGVETENQVSTSNFHAPGKDEDNDKLYGNTFLWDYYYSKSNRNDANNDKYFEYYKSTNNTLEDYPLYSAGTPYLIGFPGKRFYEFDMSGKFLAANTAAQPDKLDPQVVTFISPSTGTTIKVTDSEYETAITHNTNGKYAFTPTYQTKDLTGAYLLSSDGSSFVKATSATTVTPFHAYMTYNPDGVQRRADTRASAAGPDVLYIGYTGDTDKLVETQTDRGLTIYGNNMQITIESTLDVPATVTITTVAGKLLKQFTIQPGTKTIVPVNSRGIYIVNHHKIAVTK